MLRRMRIQRVIPWLVLWGVLALAFSAYLSHAESEARRVASFSTAAATGWVIEERRGRYSHVVVEYLVDSRSFTNKFGAAYQPDLHVGSDVVVYYNPADPSVATINDPRLPPPWVQGRTVVTLLTSTFFVFLVWKIRDTFWRRSARRRIKAI